jgi:hypothetical protein
MAKWYEGNRPHAYRVDSEILIQTPDAGSGPKAYNSFGVGLVWTSGKLSDVVGTMGSAGAAGRTRFTDYEARSIVSHSFGASWRSIYEREKNSIHPL